VSFVFSVLLCYCSCCYCVFSFVLFALYVVFSVFLFFSPLCSCAGQALLGRIKFVSITAFLLMKNVLRHSHEKKYLSGSQVQSTRS